MVILLSLNFPYENRKCALMLFPAERPNEELTRSHRAMLTQI